VALLNSSDATENKNGAALVINQAANAHSVPKLLKANVVALLLPKLNHPDDDLVMKTCWAVNNLCVHEDGRNACYSGGVLNYFGKVLQKTSSEVIKKACWALTNLARNADAQRDIVKGNVFTSLVHILIYGTNDEEKGFALQPLCNLVLEANNQLAFKNANGISAVVKLLSSNVEKTQELAVTLVSFVTTNHDSIRNELVEHGVLPPLCVLLNGSKTGKMQEYAINSLVNLSLSEHAEKAILHQHAVKPVVGLLSSDDPRLAQQAAMLLSNLLTNKDIRESVRYFGWVDPVLKLVRSGDPNTLQQILRVIINICFDEPCRYLLQKADAAKVINSVTQNANDNNIYNLSSTAIKNLSVPVSAVVQNEVQQKLSSGGIEKVNAPRAKQQEARNEIDHNDVDAVLKSFGGGHSSKPAASHQPAHHQQQSYKPPSKPAHDDLDDLLKDDFKPAPSKQPTHAAKPPPPKNNYDDLDNLLNDIKPASKPAAAAPQKHNPPPAQSKASQKSDLLDIDDLLSGIDTAPKKTTAPPPKPPAHHHDDIDDLLAGFDVPKPKPAQHKPPPSHDLDDIDDILSGMGGSSRPPAPQHNKGGAKAPAHHQSKGDDIDDLLDGIGSMSMGGGYRGSYGGDDIDDLLSDLSEPNHRQSGNTRGRGGSSGLEAIDDLLNDLTG
jgi:hypothetical protein